MFSTSQLCKYSFLILSCFLLTACEQKETHTPPENLVPESKMSAILGDMLLLDNHYIRMIGSSEDFDYEKIQFYTSPLIDKKYGLIDSQAYFSYRYYLSQPEIMKSIVQTAIDSLSQLLEQDESSEE